MDLVLLAAGFATRLEPLTLDQPKHLLPLKNGLFIDRLINQLIKAESKFNNKVLITNDNYYSKFKSYFDNCELSVDVYKDGVKNKNTRLGAIGDLLSVIDQAGLDNDLLILAADFIFDKFDFNSFIDDFTNKKSSLTVVRREQNLDEIRAGSNLLLKEDNEVQKFVEKPSEPFSDIYGCPYYLIKKSDLAIIKQMPQEKWDNCGEIVGELVRKSKVYAFCCNEEIFHMTTLNDYNHLKEL